MNILLFFYFSTFSKSTSCLSSLNPGNKTHRGVGSFSITLPTAHHILDPLSPRPDVIGKNIINDRIYFISKDCCAGWLHILSHFQDCGQCNISASQKHPCSTSMRKKYILFSYKWERVSKSSEFPGSCIWKYHQMQKATFIILKYNKIISGTFVLKENWWFQNKLGFQNRFLTNN